MFRLFCSFYFVACFSAGVPNLEAGDGKQQQHQDLLNWAIRNSDPEKLKQHAERTQESGKTVKEIVGEDFYEQMFKTEEDTMTQAIAIINLHDAPKEEVLNALEVLEELLAQVDNAMNLNKMGGMEPMIKIMSDTSRDLELRAASAWALGTAAQNNEEVQAELLEYDMASTIAAAIRSGAPNGCVAVESATSKEFAVCKKLLFLASALVRNNPEATRALDQQGIFSWIVKDVVIDSHPELPVLKKGLGMLQSTLVQKYDITWSSDLRTSLYKDAIPRALELHGGDADTLEKLLEFLDSSMHITEMSDSKVVYGVPKAIAECEKVNGEEPCSLARGVWKRIDAELEREEMKAEWDREEAKAEL